jgi:hypothetical protein
MISNDEQFKEALFRLDEVQQRILAAKFANHVLSVSSDKRLEHIVKVASDENATQEELSDALKTARAATIDSHTRCGSEGNWTDQAGYFVARAALAAVTPPLQSKAKNPAWQAALSSRMAITSMLIDKPDDMDTHSETEWQYETTAQFFK